MSRSTSLEWSITSHRRLYNCLKILCAKYFSSVIDEKGQIISEGECKMGLKFPDHHLDVHI